MQACLLIWRNSIARLSCALLVNGLKGALSIPVAQRLRNLALLIHICRTIIGLSMSWISSVERGMQKAEFGMRRASVLIIPEPESDGGDGNGAFRPTPQVIHWLLAFQNHNDISVLQSMNSRSILIIFWQPLPTRLPEILIDIDLELARL